MRPSIQMGARLKSSAIVSALSSKTARRDSTLPSSKPPAHKEPVQITNPFRDKIRAAVLEL